jgi:hypothetical protein
MKNHFLTLFLCFLPYFNVLLGQNASNLVFDKLYEKQTVSKANDLIFTTTLEKGDLYGISVKQNGIDVVVEVVDQNKQKLADKDSPNGSWGYEKMEFAPTTTATYFIQVKRLDEAGNPDTGEVTLKIKHFTKSDLIEREKIKKELAPENLKTVQTADIDHFWQAWDNLKNCKTYQDSLQSFEKIYTDRATDGFKDFMKVRDYTPEDYVEMARKLPKFYNSVRQNTLVTKKAEPLIEEVFQKFKALYPNFKPFKVCFAIGAMRSGGTVSDDFVLIGAEITTSTNKMDLSEIPFEALKKNLAGEEDIVQKIKNMVAHECVHTQQKTPLDTNSVNCNLLYQCMQEGFCDFIGELVTGSQINKWLLDYSNAHEKELWQTFKSQLCTQKTGDWLYNMSSVKDKPSDLGYYIGYKIAQSYYNNAVDKKQAVIDIIEMKNPLQFLEKSGYDKKF